MQVDYSFRLNANGTKDELRQIIGALKRIESKEFDAFLVWIRIKNLNGWTKLEELSDEISTEAFITDRDGSIDVEATGPYGHYHVLSDTGLFEIIADAAPYASFSGSIEGGSSYTTENIHCELKDAKLHIESYYECIDDVSSDYLKMLKKEMPYDKFLEIFKIDKDEYDEDQYEDFLGETDCYERFMRADFDEFMESCPESQITEEEYETLLDVVPEMSWEEFEDSYYGSTEEYDYDPINQAYLDAIKNDPLFQSGIHTISAEELGVSEEEYGKMSMEDVYAAIAKKEEALLNTKSKVDSIEFEGKNFVYTGFDPAGEREITEIVTSRGGIIKEHVSKKVDYLIVNGRSGHGTKKYDYAIELKKSGKKDIIIMDGRKFFSIARK